MYSEPSFIRTPIIRMSRNPNKIVRERNYWTSLLQTTFENIVGKGEIARDEQFLLFPQCFLPYQKIIFEFHHVLKCRLQTLSIWDGRQFGVC